MTKKEREQEQEMLTAFREQAQGVISSQGRFVKGDNSLRIGLESEVAIYRENFVLADIGRSRDAIIQKLPGITDVELGAAQVEFRTPPIDVLAQSGFGELVRVYRDRFELLVQAVRKQNCSLLRIGANPFLPVKGTPRTDRPKYRLVPDYYNQHRSKEADTIIGLGKGRVDIGDAAVVSLFQSFQVNLEARSLSDACDKMNRSFFIAPYLLAMSANARFLEFVDTRLQDMRMVAWERSHDSRTREELTEGHALRVGLPEKYFVDIADYFGRIERFPFILYQPDAAFKIAIGMTWLDARVKFIEDSAVVELRLLPTQPTIEEELLLTLLYIGRLIDSQIRDEVLLPIECVRENRLSAMLYGMHRGMWFLSNDRLLQRLPYRTGMKREIERAKQGLRQLGLMSSLDTELLKSIVRDGSPSDRLARTVKHCEGDFQISMKQALQEAGMLT